MNITAASLTEKIAFHIKLEIFLAIIVPIAIYLGFRNEIKTAKQILAFTVCVLMIEVIIFCLPYFFMGLGV